MREKSVYLAKAAYRQVRHGPMDLARRRREGPLSPPRRIADVGSGDFGQIGHEFLGFFTELGGLRPEHRVLDVGCGIGRMALPLVEYLEGGSYAGFDNGRGMVRWCQRAISSRHPEFQFEWAPVHNGRYNPFGVVEATDYRFPYEDDSFDFAFATSVFTHLRVAAARRYIDEIARVLRPGGSCLLTFFLLTPEAEAAVGRGEAMLDLRHPVAGGGTTTSPWLPERALAYPAGEVLGWLEGAGLRVREPVHFGLWSRSPGGRTQQDIVVAVNDRAAR